MNDIGYWLGRKYQILGEQAAADKTRADAAMMHAEAEAKKAAAYSGSYARAAETQSQAALMHGGAAQTSAGAAAQDAATRAGLAPFQARALAAGADAASLNAQSNARQVGLSEKLLPSQIRENMARADSDIARGVLMREQARYTHEQAGLTREQSVSQAQQTDYWNQTAPSYLNQFLLRGQGSPPPAPPRSDFSNYLFGGAAGKAKGTPRISGEGSGKVDTVPAMLAPGEAVLNKSAAEILGRGLIAALNRAGAAQMGMPAGDENAPRGYAIGSPNVAPVASVAPTPFEIGQQIGAAISGYACGTPNVQHHAEGSPYVQASAAPNWINDLGRKASSAQSQAAPAPPGGPALPEWINRLNRALQVPKEGQAPQKFAGGTPSVSPAPTPTPRGTDSATIAPTQDSKRLLAAQPGYFASGVDLVMPAVPERMYARGTARVKGKKGKGGGPKVSPQMLETMLAGMPGAGAMPGGGGAMPGGDSGGLGLLAALAGMKGAA